MNSPFIVENAINTCYIDSVLMALFFKSTTIDSVLNKDLKNTTAIYLQEYIKEKFVNAVRNGKSILMDDMEMIRVMCSHLGWKNDVEKDEYILQQDITEYYTFLMGIFEIEKITIQRKTEINNNLPALGEKEYLPFIPLSLLETNINIDTIDTIKNMLSRWQFNNLSEINNKKEPCLNSYVILNSPNVIGFSINRFNNMGKRIKTSVIIQKKIYIAERNTEYHFHSAICHSGETLNSGHYYSLLSGNSGIWYMFDDQKIPCIKEVKMDDPSITNMIKKECCFVFYRI